MGRPDYSVIAQRVAIPTYKAEQESYLGTYAALTIGSGSYAQLTDSPSSGKKIILRDIFASCDANLNLEIQIYVLENGSWVLKGDCYNYQSADLTFKGGIEITTSFLIYLINRGDKTATFSITYSGILETL